MNSNIVPDHNGVMRNKWSGEIVNPAGWQIADTSIENPFNLMIRTRRHTNESDACRSKPNGEGGFVVWDMDWDELLDGTVYATEAEAEAAAWEAMYERYDNPDVDFSKFNTPTEKNSPTGW